MPDKGDARQLGLKVYRERAQRWREAADKLPPGEAPNAHIALAEGATRGSCTLLRSTWADLNTCNHSEPAPPPR